MADLNPRKERLYQILTGNVEPDSPVIAHSGLRNIAETELPDILKPALAWTILWPLGVLLWLGQSMLLLLRVDELGSPLIAAESLFVLLILFGCLWFSKRAREKDLQNLIEALRDPLDELNELAVYLANYQQSLDRRTRTYFHCVTNSKVTAYFVMMQMTAALKERTAEINTLIEQGTRKSLAEAYRRLQGAIVFSDGAVPGRGNTYAVPLARLRKTIDLLIEHLEEGLAELEEEIKLTSREIHPYRGNGTE
ncbi:MAG: hypothetical protein D6719_13870 [Candidatus Dadabacteria bacterium]|nr:MAG: hypothetical protein D6719_13870 [Candidatus Dadabacteria bacterium]